MNTVKIQITKSWRKSLSMRFDTHGVLQVRAPKLMFWYQIEAFIQKNKAWIEKHSTKIQAQKKNAKYYLFWKEIEKGTSSFYKKQAHDYIKTRCEELAREYGFVFKNIRITSAMARWGSCSSKKNLNFSYRLVMAPKLVIDYVIVHELCHLREMNHSKKFWKQVEQIMPEYKEHEKHLKEKGWKYKIY